MSDHADIVRNNLEEIASFPLGDGRSQHRARAALAALDALVAERDALQAFKDEALQTDWIARTVAAEAERDEARREFVQIPTTAQIPRAEAAEATANDWQDMATIWRRRAEAAEAERDEARRERDKALLSVEGLSKRLTIAVAAEAEVARLREAVLLLNGMVTCGEAHSERSTAAVVAALAAPTKEGT